MSIEIPDTLTIPLHVNGTKISFTSRTPTNNELANCMHIELTNVAPWNPKSITLGQTETNQHDNNNYVQSNCTLTNEILLLNTISPSLKFLKELLLQQMNTTRCIHEI